MLDLNLLYFHKHHGLLMLEHVLYFEEVKEFIDNKKAKMNKYERIRYSLYRKVHGLKFGSIYSGVPSLTSVNKKQEMLMRNDKMLETYTLYFTYPDQEQAVNELQF